MRQAFIFIDMMILKKLRIIFLPQFCKHTPDGYHLSPSRTWFSRSGFNFKVESKRIEGEGNTNQHACVQLSPRHYTQRGECYALRDRGMRHKFHHKTGVLSK